MIGRILVGLAGTPYAATVTRTAVELAKTHNAEVTGVTIIDAKKLRRTGPVPLGGAQAGKELREHRTKLTRERLEETIEQFTSACRDAGVRSEVFREDREKPFDYLISQSRYHDVTVLGLRGIFECGVIGEAEYDASLAIVQMLSSGVRPIIAVSTEFRPVRRVMIAYSGSVESANAMKRFLQLWPSNEIDLRVVTFGNTRERSEHLLADAVRYCSALGLTPEWAHIEESPQVHLLEEAGDWGADMIVLGNSAKSLLLRRMLGETALNAIRRADRTLFLSQ
jgi:nucleotide-binding universal stress UspA family protein